MSRNVDFLCVGKASESAVKNETSHVRIFSRASRGLVSGHFQLWGRG